MKKSLKIKENPFKVGDILCLTWGYSMIIVQFYEVTRVTPSKVGLVELKQKEVSTGYLSGYTKPLLGEYIEPDGTAYNVHPDKLYSVRPGYKDEPVVRIPDYPNGPDYRSAHIWSGRDVYFDHCD